MEYREIFTPLSIGETDTDETTKGGIEMIDRVIFTDRSRFEEREGPEDGSPLIFFTTYYRIGEEHRWVRRETSTSDDKLCPFCGRFITGDSCDCGVTKADDDLLAVSTEQLLKWCIDTMNSEREMERDDPDSGIIITYHRKGE